MTTNGVRLACGHVYSKFPSRMTRDDALTFARRYADNGHSLLPCPEGGGLQRLTGRVHWPTKTIICSPKHEALVREALGDSEDVEVSVSEYLPEADTMYLANLEALSAVATRTVFEHRMSREALDRLCPPPDPRGFVNLIGMC